MGVLGPPRGPDALSSPRRQRPDRSSAAGSIPISSRICAPRRSGHDGVVRAEPVRTTRETLRQSTLPCPIRPAFSVKPPGYRRGPCGPDRRIAGRRLSPDWRCRGWGAAGSKLSERRVPRSGYSAPSYTQDASDRLAPSPITFPSTTKLLVKVTPGRWPARPGKSFVIVVSMSARTTPSRSRAR
jgi:hypothetical protein